MNKRTKKRTETQTKPRVITDAEADLIVRQIFNGEIVTTSADAIARSLIGVFEMIASETDETARVALAMSLSLAAYRRTEHCARGLDVFCGDAV